MKRTASVRKIVLSGLFAAVIFVLTALLPIPLGHGYAHAGDCFVLLAGIMLGPWAGMAAAGFGSMLADVFLGYYIIYAPATLVIKALMALTAALLCRRAKNKSPRMSCLISAAACVCAEAIMVFSYFLYETVLFGVGVALIDCPGNLLQAAFGSVTATLLLLTLKKTKIADNLFG